jgi:SAM-dependent methyltransferase
MRRVSFNLGSFSISASVSRHQDPRSQAYARKLQLSYARALEKRFPELCDFSFTLTEENAEVIVAFYVAYLPLVRVESRSAAVRSMLKDLIDATNDERLKNVAALAIAKSNLDDGLPDRALPIRDIPKWTDEAEKLEQAYGARIISRNWSTADRGSALRHYFAAHAGLMNNRDVLHIAPEKQLESWLREQSSNIGIRSYVCVDGQYSQGGHQDITAMTFPSESFDLVICHRVMEHVLDDAAGFSELFRVLRPEGLLNFSVPMMPQRPRTNEWAVPDESHDGHVRHYGADLADRLAAAGFAVELEPWLLNRPEAELRAANAYPMRLYNARKPPIS